MVDHLQDVFLVLNMINVLALNNIVFLHGLDSKLLSFVFLQVAKLYITESTYRQSRVSIQTFSRLIFIFHQHSSNPGSYHTNWIWLTRPSVPECECVTNA